MCYGIFKVGPQVWGKTLKRGVRASQASTGGNIYEENKPHSDSVTGDGNGAVLFHDGCDRVCC